MRFQNALALFRMTDMTSQKACSTFEQADFVMSMDSGYRYTFNGQEQENELNPSITSAEYWMYDGRLGRRWNLDPVVKECISLYSTFGNKPVYYIDPSGDDWYSNGEGTTAFYQEGNDAEATRNGETFKNIGEKFSSFHSIGDEYVRTDYVQDKIVRVTTYSTEFSQPDISSFSSNDNMPKNSSGPVPGANLSSQASANNGGLTDAARLSYDFATYYQESQNTQLGKQMSIAGYVYDAGTVIVNQIEISNQKQLMENANSIMEYHIHKRAYENAINAQYQTVGGIAFGYLSPPAALTWGALSVQANSSYGQIQQAQIARIEMEKWYNKRNKSTYQRKQYEYWKEQYYKTIRNMK
jgi:RHS repeat-associated protein